MDNDELLKQFGELIDQQLEPIKTRLDQQGIDIKHISTALEALAEGQREMQETMATKVAILNLGVKIDKNHRSTSTRLQLWKVSDEL